MIGLGYISVNHILVGNIFMHLIPCQLRYRQNFCLNYFVFSYTPESPSARISSGSHWLGTYGVSAEAETRKRSRVNITWYAV